MTIYDYETYQKFVDAFRQNETIEILGSKFYIRSVSEGYNSHGYWVHTVQLAQMVPV